VVDIHLAPTTLPNGTIVYNISPRLDTGIHTEKRVKLNGDIEYRYSLYAGGMPFAIKNVNISAAGAFGDSTTYLHMDHLGSIVAVSDQVGNVTERRSYDAWGKRRNSNGTAMNNAFVTPDVRYAFAGQEDLGEVGLINMNGRVYDPAIGRFISADPYIQYPDDMQNYNRYSYINNNPLLTTDPSGHRFFLASIARGIVRGIGRAIGAVLRNPIVRTVLTVVAAYYGGVWAGNLFSAASTSFSGLSGIAYSIAEGAAIGAGAGFAGGFVASGGNIKAALTGAIAGAVTGGVMGYYGSDYGISRVFANGVANGVSAKIQGRDFMDGLRSGLMTSAFTYGNVLMRKNQIDNSLGLDVTPENRGSSYLNNGTGLSAGMIGDGFKLGGERLNAYLVSIGKVFGGPLGGTQNAPGRLFFYHYEKGGFIDMTIESFAGPHDFANSSHFYNADGTGFSVPGLKGTLLNATTNMSSSLLFAAPFAAAAISEQSNYSAYRYAR
jgi:RHS repeat-associated protein